MISPLWEFASVALAVSCASYVRPSATHSAGLRSGGSSSGWSRLSE